MPAVKSTETFDIRTGDSFSFRQATFVQMISLQFVFVVPNWENKERRINNIVRDKSHSSASCLIEKESLARMSKVPVDFITYTSATRFIRSRTVLTSARYQVIRNPPKTRTNTQYAHEWQDKMSQRHCVVERYNLARVYCTIRNIYELMCITYYISAESHSDIVAMLLRQRVARVHRTLNCVSPITCLPTVPKSFLLTLRIRTKSWSFA